MLWYFKYHEQVVSIVIARNDANAKAPTARAGDTAAAFTYDSYQIATFQTTNHAVFVISSLNETDNMTIARAVSPLLENKVAAPRNRAKQRFSM